LQEETVSEDLEEEIDNYVKRNGYDGLDSIEEVKYIANHFAKWQKEQMMKVVKEAQVILTRITNATLAPSLSRVILDDSFKEGDKVKVILIKED
jgi:ribosomal protein L3